MLNPSAEVPVLNGENGTIAGHYAITEWLEERGGAINLMPDTGLERAETRRIMAWFDEKFNLEVGQLVTHEKIHRRFMSKNEGGGTPDVELVRIGLTNLKIHMSYICHLLEQRDWLAGNRLTMADLTAAAHLSCLDYTGDINWHEWSGARDWYAGLKSRPSFRPLLADTIAGFPPAKDYTNLDF